MYILRTCKITYLSVIMTATDRATPGGIVIKWKSAVLSPPNIRQNKKRYIGNGYCGSHNVKNSLKIKN